MSGHSKWAQIKRQKEATDRKKGQAFSRLSKAITLAAKEKGGDPETNFALRLALEKAKQANMPQVNVERAIKKGEGSEEGGAMEEVFYEIYGPAGAAVIAQAITDNKNRTVSEVKNILSKNNGRLGETNSVRWLFEEKGVLRVKIAKNQKEEFILAAIEAGAEDIREEGEDIAVITKKEDFQKVKEALDKKTRVDSAAVELLAKNPLEISEPSKIKQIKNFLEKLEQCEDITNLFSNLKE